MPPRLRVGIAGLGLASTFTLPYLAQHPDVQITAAADVRPSARERFAREFGGETFASVADLCGSAQVDALYICTPNSLHAEHAVLAAEQKKHVLIEKPMALTLEECDRMIAAAERNGVWLLYGHTHSYDPPIRKLWELVRGGAYGRLNMIHTWNYTDILYRPRAEWELDPARGGGVVYLQASHQIDVVRLIGGGLVRSVRATVGVGDPERPAPGHYTAYLEFEDGTPATLVYSGYGYFDSAALHYGVGERGQERAPETNARTWANYRARQAVEAGAQEVSRRESVRYGGNAAAPSLRTPPAGWGQHQFFFGITVVSCGRADLRQSPDGVYVYDERGQHEIPLPPSPTGNQIAVDELYQAAVHDRQPLHDGRWGKATLEVALAMVASDRERREIMLAHQVPVPR